MSSSLVACASTVYSANEIESSILRDFGDAPAPYATLESDNGAAHVLSDLKLGSLVNTENDGVHSEYADQGSDDDGVTFEKIFG